jgi:RNA-directed DNA polymerase
MYQRNLFTQNLSLFERLCDLETLREGFQAVRKNKGSPGIDGKTIAAFEESLEDELAQLKKDLESWSYKPLPVRRVEIPKSDGKSVRKLGIPCVRDRVCQATIKLILEPILDPTFSESSFGFRPGRGQQQAIKAACSHAKAGKEFTVDIDLEQFFDRICQDRLISQLGKRIDDKRILRIIGDILRSGVMIDGVMTSTPEGTTQGSPLSPLLSNVVLDELDKELEKRELSFCRFADDCNIFVKTPKAATRVLNSVSKFLEKKMKLKVNPTKSKAAPSKEVKFLGMTIANKTVAISQKAMDRAMETVKTLTARGTSLPAEESIKLINQWYNGWASYYRMTQYPSQFRKVEAHIRRRLRCRFIGQQKRRRYLVKKLVKLGVPKALASKTVFSNKGWWALAHSPAVERAWTNKWFEDKGLSIWSDRKLEGWFGIRRWIRLA